MKKLFVYLLVIASLCFVASASAGMFEAETPPCGPTLVNMSFNETFANQMYWRLDGTNDPPTSDWEMGGYGFRQLSYLVGQTNLFGQRNNITFDYTSGKTDYYSVNGHRFHTSTTDGWLQLNTAPNTAIISTNMFKFSLPYRVEFYQLNVTNVYADGWINGTNFNGTYYGDGSNLEGITVDCVPTSFKFAEFQDNAAPTYGGYLTLSGAVDPINNGSFVTTEGTITNWVLQSLAGDCDCTPQQPFDFDLLVDDVKIGHINMDDKTFSMESGLSTDVYVGSSVRVNASRGSVASCSIGTDSCSDMQAVIWGVTRCS